jgi:anhydro-N-acetylmuramic acid kinase
MKSYYVIGLMSGTSLDGVDICYVKFKYNDNWSFKMKRCGTIKYDKYWYKKLSTAYLKDDKEIQNINIEYSIFLSEIVNDFIKKNKIKKIDFVSSHGHTIFHQPERAYTLQIGNLINLKKLIKIPLICDFRIDDIKLNGQGAPLVPIGDLLLFNKYTYCLNLGGFSNITLKKNKSILAFDICAVNVVLNKYSRQLGLAYDVDGDLAKLGKINQNLLNELNNISYYTNTPPKSLGIEWVNKNIFPIIDKYKLKTKDILRTYTEHISVQIKESIDCNNSNILVTGGGAKNKFLLSLIFKKLKNKIIIPSDELIDFKEALIFAFLGVLKFRNENNCLSSVTGASRDHSSGVIFK